MKLWFSKPKKGKKRHVVLDMTTAEDYEAHRLIRQYVLGRGVKPVRAQKGQKVRYRFHMRYLDQLLLLFPFAELSPGVERQLARAVEAELQDVPELEVPGLNDIELYGYQKIGVARALEGFEEFGAYLINDEMGLGKTFQALAAALLLDLYPVLVVCPNNAKWVWERAITNHTDLEAVVVDGSPAQRSALISKQADITIANVEQLRAKAVGRGRNTKWDYSNPEFFDIEYGLVIADEFHRFKNPQAQQTKGFHRLKHDYFLGMSGTPILNRAEEAWSALHKAKPDKYPSYWSFEKWLCIKGRFSTIAYRPEAMAEVKDDLQNVSVRRRKDQVLKDLPRVIPVQRPVRLTGEQRRLYDRIERDSKLELETGEVQAVNGILPMITRCKQAAFSPELYEGSSTSAKINELKELMEELTRNNEKAIVFSQWSRATRIIARELEEYNPAYVDGSIKGDKRMEQVDKFNEDRDCKVYIGTIGANKEAITLSAATYVIFTDKDWNPQNNAQAAARSAAGGLRGVGQDKPVHIVSLVAENTIEERIEALLEQKQQLFNALVERDGGHQPQTITVEDMRSLFELDDA